MASDIHISSFIIHAAPGAMSDLTARLLDLDCEIVPTRGDASRLVALVERTSDRSVAETLDVINTLPGVYSALPVYHHAEPAAALAEPMP